MFIVNKNRVGQRSVLVIVLCGSFKPTGRNNPPYCPAPQSFFDECRQEQYNWHDEQIDKALSNLDQFEEVIITRYRNHRIEFNNQEKVIAGKIKKRAPVGVLFTIKIPDLMKILGDSFVKPDFGKKNSNTANSSA
jgi:hypothetical protein